MNIRTTLLNLALGLFLLVLSACTSSGPPSPTISPDNQLSATDVVIQATRTLNICIAQEPDSLFLYGNSAKSAASIFQAIYDGPIDTRSYDSQAIILEKLPSLADSDANFEAVAVNPGDIIVDARGDPTPLGSGVTYFPAGCRDETCEAIYTGQESGSVSMDQMVVTYLPIPALKWSDGVALTAEDSVYSFELAKSLANPAKAHLISRTQTYLSLDSNKVEWRGLPGFRNPNYMTDFFTPLPKHAWETIPESELLTSPASARQPLSYGPFQIDEWVTGQSITLIKNPHYFRAGEGLPRIDILKFNFIGPDPATAVNALLAGECDILDESIDLSTQIDRLLDLQAADQIQLIYAPGNAWQHLDFGIQPVSYDEFYNVAQGDRPDFFGDVRTRQAIASCIDRDTIVNQLAYGQATVLDTYISASHPLFNSDVPAYPYDPAAGIALLEQVGWVMGEEGVRVSQGVVGIPDGVTFEVSYFTTASAIYQDTAQIIGKSLLNCGIKINISSGTPQELFDPGPNGLLFGRKFDLGQFAWPLEKTPSCYLYFGAAVPGSDIERFAYSWGGWNLTGWNNPEFDAACAAAQNALPGEPDYTSNNFLAQQIFATELPVIPLFIPPKYVAARPDLCGLELDASDNLLWNVESFDYGEFCLPTP